MCRGPPGLRCCNKAPLDYTAAQAEAAPDVDPVSGRGGHKPPCSAVSAATSTSASGLLAQHLSSSWYRELSAEPGPGRESPTFLQPEGHEGQRRKGGEEERSLRKLKGSQPSGLASNMGAQEGTTMPGSCVSSQTCSPPPPPCCKCASHQFRYGNEMVFPVLTQQQQVKGKGCLSGT